MVVRLAWYDVSVRIFPTGFLVFFSSVRVSEFAMSGSLWCPWFASSSKSSAFSRVDEPISQSGISAVA